jgi:predicted lipid-binding transport protein (Tim44 family)
MKWLLAVIVLLYALSPYDFFPDLIVGWGWLDDIALMGLVWYLFFRRPILHSGQSASDENHDSQKAQGHSRKSASDQIRDPYAILGLREGASQEDIRAAYRQLAAQYHPDKLAHLGEEFQALAEQKFKDIQSAYDVLRDPR